MKYVIFDILYLTGGTARNGESVEQLVKRSHSSRPSVGAVVGLPLTSRRQLLQGIVQQSKNRIELIGQLPVLDSNPAKRTAKVFAQLDKAIENRLEGIIIKDSTSHYAFGEASRRMQKWVKLKPEYADMQQDIDVIIVAAYYGEGKRRAGRLSHFLTGVLENPYDDKRENKVVSFCKVGTGYSLEQLDDINQRLKPHLQPWPKNGRSPPNSCIKSWKPGKTDDIPNMWVAPENSIVLQVMGAELTKTDQFTTQITLRFPRVKHIRFDKPWTEINTLHDIREHQRKGKKLRTKTTAKSVAAGGGMLPAHRRRPAKKQRTGRVGGVMAQFVPTTFTDVQKRSAVFQGLLFSCPMKAAMKAKVEKEVYSHGGTVVQNPTPSMKGIFILADEASNPGTKLRNYVKQGAFDVVDVAWMRRCVQSGKVEEVLPQEYVHKSEATACEMSAHVDAYGDSFTAPTTTEELRRTFMEVGRVQAVGMGGKGGKGEVGSAASASSASTSASAKLRRASKRGAKRIGSMLAPPPADTGASSASSSASSASSASASPSDFDADGVAASMWQSMLGASDEFLAEEVDAMETDGTCLWRVVVYADIFPTVRHATLLELHSDSHGAPGGGGGGDGSGSASSAAAADELRVLRLKTSAYTLRLRGARVSPLLDASVTHVLVDESDMRHMGEIRRVLRFMREANRGLEKQIVTSEWVRDCEKAKEQVEVLSKHLPKL